MNNKSKTVRIILWSELDETVPYSRAHIWRMEKLDHFPRRVKLGANRVVWMSDEIEDWIEKKKAQRSQ